MTRLFAVRRLGLILIGVGAALAALITFSVLGSQAPQYRSRAVLLIRSADAAEDWSRLAASYTELLTSPDVLQPARDAAHLPDTTIPQIGGVLLPGTQLFEISVTALDPAQATALTEALSAQMIAASERFSDNSALTALKKQAVDLQSQMDATHSDLQTLSAQIVAAPVTRDPAALADLRARRDDLILQYLLLQSNSAAVTAQLDQAQRGSHSLVIAESATPAARVTALPLGSAVALAALIGGALGSGIGLIIENFDNTLRSPDAIRRVLGIPVLGIVPQLRFRPGDEKPFPPADSAYGEPYRALGTRLGLNSGMTSRVLAISSATSGEGKSLTTANLGIALAQAGRQVLIIDADLRTPAQHKIFKLNNRDGLTTLLYEFAAHAAHDSEDSSASVDLAIDLASKLKRTEIAQLTLLSSGPLPPNPGEIVGSVQMLNVVQAFTAQFDVILIDAPPVLLAADTLAFVSNLESVLIVVDAQRTRRRSARLAIRQLRQANASVRGVLLNCARAANHANSA